MNHSNLGEKEVPDFKYTPVISAALVEDSRLGRTGFVHQPSW